jgi:hypothetical protein
MSAPLHSTLAGVSGRPCGASAWQHNRRVPFSAIAHHRVCAGHPGSTTLNTDSAERGAAPLVQGSSEPDCDHQTGMGPHRGGHGRLRTRGLPRPGQGNTSERHAPGAHGHRPETIALLETVSTRPPAVPHRTPAAQTWASPIRAPARQAGAPLHWREPTGIRTPVDGSVEP